jgi:peptidyl-prolyl cis-trans isomerase A (cyclophilin A)
MIQNLFHRWCAVASVLIVILGSTASSSAQYTNGIYAEFYTSMGSFTCRLEYAYAPRTVANFIGLATGQRAWLDLPSGLAKTNPFYNGTTFHRVIAGFMIQGGSPNGLGTDGPGYEFVDEFTNSLRHDGFGTLSMANSGPDSNGSQYFVAVSPQPQLNDVHTIFGRLYGGSNVVYAINHVATDANDKPLTNVVVQNVVIQRVGTAAQAFDINAQGLPVVTNRLANIAKVSTNLSITFSNQLYTDTRLYFSTNLLAWSAAKFGIDVTLPITTGILTGPVLPAQFFRIAQVQYPPTLYVPKNVLNRTIILTFQSGIPGTITSVFDNAGGGSYSWSGGASGPIVFYTYTQAPYRGRFSPVWFNGFPIMVLHLDYDSASIGTFKGTAYPTYPSSTGSYAVTGTFTSS